MSMTYLHSGARNRRSGSAMQKMKARGAAKSWHEARTVAAGFPWDGRFESLDTARSYLSGERVACLLCGREFRTLGIHLTRVHDFSPSDYRLRFNIPQSWPLEPTSRTQQRRDHGLRPENMQRMATLHKLDTEPRSSRRAARRCDLIQTQSKDILETRGLTARGPRPERRLHDDFSWHLNMVETVFDFREVAPPKGLASWSIYKKRRRIDPELAAAHVAARARRPRSGIIRAGRAGDVLAGGSV